MLCHIGYCIWLAMLSYCKSTQILSYKHQHHQKIIQYSDNLTIIHTILTTQHPCDTMEGEEEERASRVFTLGSFIN